MIIKINTKTVISLITALILTSCTKTDLEAPETHHKFVAIQTGNNTNNKFALRIDFVQVYDKMLYATLKTMNAKEFEAKKEELSINNAEDFTIWSIDFMDNQKINLQFPSHKNYWGIIVFLHFMDSHLSKIIIPQTMEKVKIEIKNSTFEYKIDEIGRKYQIMEPGVSFNLN